MRRFLPHLMLLALALAFFPAHADDLSPRAEINFRAGTERSILMTEFWAPLAQQNDRVLYGDLRLMGDGDENREGNIGFGYRQISKKTNSVLGANAWIDRRRTENGNTFHQLTLGVESLGEKIDLRANGYIQLNNSKSKVTPNIGSATPYLVGSGIFYDTNGFIVEEPQNGFDAEIGYRLPVFEKQVDSLRAYAGGYHFWGDTTKNTIGFRIRTEAQINSIFSIGARFQHDAPRGSQGFLEATLRFPFSAKKSFQKEGLRSRLDESPERDIDIVTGAKVDNGLMKPVLNASGTTQRILYVDNTNSNAGDGSKENPFNTLKAAEAAMQVNDILYVNRGDGTSTGMDKGIILDKKGVTLTGSGSALTYNGFTLIEAGLAPVLTNTEVTTDSFNGNVVLGLTGDLTISGLTLTGGTRSGVNIRVDGEHVNYITIDNVLVTNNGIVGLGIKPLNFGIIDTITVKNTTVTQNGASATNGGSFIATEDNGQIGVVFIENSNFNNNFGYGLSANSTSGKINNYIISNTQFNSNTGNGFVFRSNSNAATDSVILENLIVNGNGSNGISIDSSTNSLINNLLVKNLSLTGNTVNGISIIGTSNGIINQITGTNIISSDNGSSGVFLQTGSAAVFGSVTLDNTTTNNNDQQGIYFVANGAYGSITLNNITANTNAQRGINVTTNNVAGSIASISLSSVIANNNLDGVLINASSNGRIRNVTMNSIITSGNRHGVYLVAQTAATLSNVSLSNITSTGNTNGLYVNQTSSGGGITNISVSNSNFTGNTGNGAYLQNASTTASYTIDLGGGAFGSIGQNRIFGNTANDLNLDRAVITAGSNWWNNGGAAPTRVTTANGGSATYTTPLATDPRP